MSDKVSWLGKSGGIAVQAVLLTALNTTLLATSLISEATWANILTWIWGTYIGGSAIAAFRDIRRPIV